jgi:hypothetical protein
MELVLVGFALSLAFGPTQAGANADPPSISIDPVTSVAVGDTVLVRFADWPQGPVLVSVCGNQARRGTEDCAVLASATESIASRSAQVGGIRVVAPPVPCPCVIRATTPTNDLLATVPLDIRGVPIGQPIDPTGPADPSALVVAAWVRSVDEQFPRSFYGAFGGPTKQVLVVRLRNRGTTNLTDLRIAAAVGRSTASGNPIVAAKVATIAPGKTRTIRVPFTLDAPNYGSYTVHGTVFGLASTRTFQAKADNDPWALVLLVPLAMVVYAQVLRARERRSRRQLRLAEQRATAAGPAHEFNANTAASTGYTAALTVETFDDEIVLDADAPDTTDAPSTIEQVPAEQPIPVGATGGSLT